MKYTCWLPGEGWCTIKKINVNVVKLRPEAFSSICRPL